MTASEWATCTDPTAMVQFLGTSRKLSQRKWRLFAVACCRRVWHVLPDPRSRSAVEVAERYADGFASVEELSSALAEAERAARGQERTAARAAAELDPLSTAR